MDVRGVRALTPARDTADALAQHEWPRLYDPDVLAATPSRPRRRSTPRTSTSSARFAEQTAAAMPNFRAWVTSEYDHNGLRVDGERILTRLLDLVRGRA